MTLLTKTLAYSNSILPNVVAYHKNVFMTNTLTYYMRVVTN
jgi:hypothetical protein